MSLSLSPLRRFCVSGSASQLVKKFYTDVSTRVTPSPVPASFPNHQYEVLLNGSPVKTSKRNVMRVPTPELAFLIKSEFDIQSTFMKFATMPLYVLSKTSVDIDHSPAQRLNLMSSLLSMVDTDTAVYREDPRTSLGKLQASKLNPCIAHVNCTYRLGLKENFGLQNNQLSLSSLALLQEKLDKFDNWQLLAVEQMASVYKSTTLALCVLDKFVTYEEAFWLSRIEETYQA